MTDKSDKAFSAAKSYHARMAPRSDLIDVIDAFKAGAEYQSQQEQGEAVGYVLPSGIKQLKKDHPTDIYAPDNPVVPGSHRVWLYAAPPAPAAVPEDVKLAFDALDNSYYRAWRKSFELGDREPSYVAGNINTLAVIEIIEWARRFAAAATPSEPDHIADVNKKVEEESEENHG